MVDSAREEVAKNKATSNMNARRSGTRSVIVEAMLTNPPPPFLVERDEVRAARR